jgi:hypothetical protein
MNLREGRLVGVEYQNLLIVVAAIQEEGVEEMTELEFVEHLGVLKVEPGDVVVVKVGRLISDAAFFAISGYVEKTFPSHKCLLLEAGMEVGVMRDGKTGK